MFSLGTVPFSATSEWNELIAPDASYTKLDWPKAQDWNYGVNWANYSPAVYISSPSDPLVQIRVPDSWGHPGGTISVRMPPEADGAIGEDSEVLIIDGDLVYNFWQFERTSATTATASAYGFTNVVTGTGWGAEKPFVGAGTTAIGSNLLSGLLVEAETDAGAINHALQLVVDYELVKPGFTGNAISGDGGNPSGIVIEGDHLGIPPGTPMPSGLSPLGQQVFRALQQYGAYVVDVAGGTTVLRAQANAYDQQTMWELGDDMDLVLPLLQRATGGTVPAENQPPTQMPTSATTLSTLAASGAEISSGNGHISSGTVQLTLNFSGTVNVTGTPTLTLSTGGTARYVSGSGSKTLLFDYQVAAGQNTSDLAVTAFNLNGVRDLAGNALNLTSAPRNPAGTLTIDTKAPTLSSLAADGNGLANGNGTLRSGTVRLSLGFDEAVNVSGTPTLALNNGGVARYVSGSGSKTLLFDYQVAAGQNTSDLAVTAFNLNGVRDLAGNALNLTSAPRNPAGTLTINTSAPTTPTDSTAPTLSTLAASGTGITNGSGTLRSGTVRLSLGFDEAVNVSGTPTLALNNGGVARYVSGSGSKTLLFDYQVAAGQNTSDLAVTAFNLNGVRDLAGNALNLTSAPRNPAGTLTINTSAPTTPTDSTAPTLSTLAASGTGITNGSGTLRSGTVRLSLGFDEAVNVSGTPTLALNNGGVARYVSGSGSKTLLFDYQVAAGQNTSDLAVTAFNLNGVRDLAGNALNLTSAPRNPAGTLTIDTKAPTLSSLAADGNGLANGNGTLRSGTVRLSLGFDEAVNVSGTPTLALNNGGVARYVSGSGSKTLLFDYQVAAGQNTSDLAVTAFNLNGVRDLAGNALNLTSAPRNPAGTLTINTSAPTTPTDSTAPTLSTLAASGTGITNGSGTLRSGTVRLSLGFDEAVNVSGTPTLALNNGGVARYVSGSGSKTLLFDYQVAAGQNTSDLAVTAFNLNGVRDLAGNALNLTSAPRNPAGTLTIDTKAPTLSSLAADGNGLANGNGTLRSGTVRLSLGFDEAVNVSGTPTLALNNGGVARYVSGSGSKTLLFDYQVAAGQNTSDLAVTAFNLGGVNDRAGNALNLAHAPRDPAGTLKINNASPSAALNTRRLTPAYWDKNSFDLADIASSLRTTLAYKPHEQGAADTSYVSDAFSAAKLQLLGQYMASSFTKSSVAAGGIRIQDASANAWESKLTKSS